MVESCTISRMALFVRFDLVTLTTVAHRPQHVVFTAVAPAVTAGVGRAGQPGCAPENEHPGITERFRTLRPGMARGGFRGPAPRLCGRRARAGMRSAATARSPRAGPHGGRTHEQRKSGPTNEEREECTSASGPDPPDQGCASPSPHCGRSVRIWVTRDATGAVRRSRGRWPGGAGTAGRRTGRRPGGLGAGGRRQRPLGKGWLRPVKSCCGTS